MTIKGASAQKWALIRGALESLEEEDMTVTFLRHALIAVRGFDSETAASYGKRIGNLVLLPAKSNAALGNNDFATKAAVFGQAPYELTRQVAGVPQWTPAVIAERQRILAELAVRTWPL